MSTAVQRPRRRFRVYEAALGLAGTGGGAYLGYRYFGELPVYVMLGGCAGVFQVALLILGVYWQERRRDHLPFISVGLLVRLAVVGVLVSPAAYLTACWCFDVSLDVAARIFGCQAGLFVMLGSWGFPAGVDLWEEVDDAAADPKVGGPEV